MKKSVLVKSFAIIAFAVFAVGAVVYSMRPRFDDIRKGKPDEGYVKSQDCRACHQDHYGSWRETHHSRMTQEATPETVQGDFEKQNEFEYLGVKSRMERRGRDFYMNFTTADGKTEAVKVERTIGSRRMEQYLGKRNGQYTRLPIAYDLMQRRWTSLNGSFFYPDGDNFNQHAAQWDTNCVFCHNVKAQPNFDFKTSLAKTEVAELGIACGSCHGQGAEHVALASSPLRRALWSFQTSPATKIVNPKKLDTDRSTMICGHCHGQRIPEPQKRIREVLTADPFDAGENLEDFYKPIHADTKIGNVSFASRFWPDGSPRLTAYEYQGMTDSACFKNAPAGNRISCLSCHSMHDGDVKGNITAEKRTNQACTSCHQNLAETASLAAHTKHDAASSGSSCYSCHMPEVVYGVMSFHPTHKISVPDASLTASKGVPNACNQCHLDKSLNWAIGSSKTLWPKRFGSATASADKQFDEIESLRGLYAGDALTRAMMADAIGRKADRSWAQPYLLEAFEGENYPIVRYFAASPFKNDDPEIPRPDYLGDLNSRTRAVELFRKFTPAQRADEARKIAARLRSLRRDVDLEVGE